MSTITDTNFQLSILKGPSHSIPSNRSLQKNRVELLKHVLILILSLIAIALLSCSDEDHAFCPSRFPVTEITLDSKNGYPFPKNVNWEKFKKYDMIDSIPGKIDTDSIVQ